MVDAFQAALGLAGLAEENLQARIRGVIWMGLSNQHGHLVLACGNKSELSVGYSTIYGDAVGGFAPIKDVPEDAGLGARAVAERRRRSVAGETPPIPENSIAKPPSAELRPGQLDTDSLPDYALLDDVLDDYVEQDRGRDRAAGRRVRPGAGRTGPPADRPGRVQAPAVPAGTEDLAQGLRPRPAAADHQPLARAGSASLTARGTMVTSGDSSREPRG